MVLGSCIKTCMLCRSSVAKCSFNLWFWCTPGCHCCFMCPAPACPRRKSPHPLQPLAHLLRLQPTKGQASHDPAAPPSYQHIALQLQWVCGAPKSAHARHLMHAPLTLLWYQALVLGFTVSSRHALARHLARDFSSSGAATYHVSSEHILHNRAISCWEFMQHLGRSAISCSRRSG